MSEYNSPDTHGSRGHYYFIALLFISCILLAVSPAAGYLRVIAGGLIGVAFLALGYLWIRSRRMHSPSYRVLVVTQALGIGGLEKMVLHLCRQIQARRGWYIAVFAYDQEPIAESQTLIPDFRGSGIDLEVFQKPPSFSPMVVVRMIRNIIKNDIHIVHCQDLGGLIYAVLAKIFTAGRFRLVHTQHSFVHLKKAGRYEMYEKIFMRFVDELTVVSEDTKTQYVQLGYPEEKVHLIENGVNFPEHPITTREIAISQRPEVLASISDKEARDALAARMKDSWILYLARLFPLKGHDHAFQLWRELDPERRKSVVLILVGPEAQAGERARLEQLRNELPDSDRVIFVGGSHVPELWIRCSDLFLSCSEFEGMPMAALEAIGSGLPAVLTDIPGHHFFRSTSLLYPLSDARAGARAVSRILHNLTHFEVVFRHELWESARALRDEYSLERMGARYATLYRSFDASIPSTVRGRAAASAV